MLEGVSPSPPGYGLGRGLYRPRIQQFASLLDLKVEHFGPVFTLDLTEETRTQLQEEEAIVSYWLRLWSRGIFEYLPVSSWRPVRLTFFAS